MAKAGHSGIGRIQRATRISAQGIASAWKNEAAFRQELLLTVVLLPIAVWLGQTALHRVAQQGNMQACRLLLQYGVDPSIVSVQGYSAAQLATDNIQKMLRGEASL